MYQDAILSDGTRVAVAARPEASSSFQELQIVRPGFAPIGHLSNDKGINGSSLRIPQIDAVLKDEKELTSGNLYPLPTSFTVSVSSASGGSTTRVYLLQQSTLNNITSNGATAITYSYTDGFSGRNISNAVALARGGVGALCYGCQLTFNITSTGAADVAGLNNANAYWATFDPATGQPMTDLVNTAANQSRSDTNFALSVDIGVVNLSSMKQLSFLLSSGSTATATFYLTSDFRL